MGYRRLLTAITALALVAVLGCSKTQDTPAETKIFGQPPQINSASLDVSQRHVLCDFTQPYDSFFATNGDLLQVSPGPLMVGGTYTQFMFHANVSDPQGKNDIILVTASFTYGGGALPQETSLVLFDDGSSAAVTGLLVYQQTGAPPLNCRTIGGQVSCVRDDNIPLTSNDPVAGDGNYTRGYAFTNFSTSITELGSQVAQDCVAKQAKQFPDGKGVYATAGSTLSFRIDAVDKEGNLTPVNTRQTGTVGTSTFECSGDDCLCCFARCGTSGLTSPTPNCAPGALTTPDGMRCCNCAGLPGLIGPTEPAGLCIGF